MITAATAPIRIFLLPPDASGSALAPPNVKEGAEPTIGAAPGATSACFSGMVTGAGACDFGASGASSGTRAGAGALAAPLVGDEKLGGADCFKGA